MYKLLLGSALILGAASAHANEHAQPMPANEWPASASAPMPAASAMSPVRARDGEIIDSRGGGAIPELPLVVMSNGTMKYVTGGIGEEELAQLKSLENDFNIQMLIAATGGSFMGNATVRVIDMKDTVLFTVEDAGPYVYFSLPSGDYMIEVTASGGNMKSMKVRAPSTGATKPTVRFSGAV